MKRNSPSPQDQGGIDAEGDRKVAAKRPRPSSSGEDAKAIESQEEPKAVGAQLKKASMPKQQNKTKKKAKTASEKKPKPFQDVLKNKARHRLPDKLMQCLMEGIEPDVIWWSPHENGFTLDSETVQEKLLNVHFRGTKLTSLVRSLNRWGFRRDFYRSLPKQALAFAHTQFKKDAPHLLKDMKILPSTTQVEDSDSDDQSEEESKEEPTGEGKKEEATKKTLAANAPTPLAARVGAPSDPNRRDMLSISQQQQQQQQQQQSVSTIGHPPAQQPSPFELSSLQLTNLRQQDQIQPSSLQASHLIAGNSLLRQGALLPAQGSTASHAQQQSRVASLPVTDQQSDLASSASLRSVQSLLVQLQQEQQERQRRQEQQQQQEQETAAILAYLQGLPSAETPRETERLALQGRLVAEREQEIMRLLQLRGAQRQAEQASSLFQQSSLSQHLPSHQIDQLLASALQRDHHQQQQQQPSRIENRQVDQLLASALLREQYLRQQQQQQPRLESGQIEQLLLSAVEREQHQQQHQQSLFEAQEAERLLIAAIERAQPPPPQQQQQQSQLEPHQIQQLLASLQQRDQLSPSIQALLQARRDEDQAADLRSDTTGPGNRGNQPRPPGV